MTVNPKATQRSSIHRRSRFAGFFKNAISDRDGTAIGMLGRNLFYVALSTPQALGFDPLSLNFVGSPELANRVCAVIDTAQLKRAEELFEHEAIMAGLGAGSGPSSTARLMRNLLGMKFSVVEGYTSGRNGVLAIEHVVPPARRIAGAGADRVRFAVSGTFRPNREGC